VSGWIGRGEAKAIWHSHSELLTHKSASCSSQPEKVGCVEKLKVLILGRRNTVRRYLGRGPKVGIREGSHLTPHYCILAAAKVK